MRLSLFLTVVITILLTGSLYLARRFNHSVEFFGRRPWIAPSLAVAFVAFTLLAHFVAWNRQGMEPLSRPMIGMWLTYLALGGFLILLVYTLFVDIGGLLLKGGAWSAGKTLPADLGRRSFLGALAGAGATFLVGSAQAKQGPRIREIEIPIEGLPEALEDFRILQITDLHVGPLIGRAYVEKVVEASMAVKPDLIVLTGDIVDGSVQQLELDVEPISRLKAPHGTYFVTGNHDFYSGAASWMRHWESLGLRVLANAHEVRDVSGAKLVIAGIHDASGGARFADLGDEFSPNPLRAFQGAPDGATRIFLAHQPKHFEEAEGFGAHLQLSGHTHAGQFFPWCLFVPLAYKYHSGLNRHKRMWIYVGAGAGWWGPPNRFGIPSEIAVLKLRRA